MDAETIKTLATIPLPVLAPIILLIVLYFIVKYASKMFNYAMGVIENNTKAMVGLQSSVDRESDALIGVKKDISDVKIDLKVHCAKVDKIEDDLSETKNNVSSIKNDMSTMKGDISNMDKKFVTRNEFNNRIGDMHN